MAVQIGEKVQQKIGKRRFSTSLPTIQRNSSQGNGFGRIIKEGLVDSVKRNTNQVARVGTHSWLKAGH